MSVLRDSPAQIGPHGAQSCKVKGCNSHTPVLPGECSCDYNCGERHNCCFDYQQLCEADSCSLLGCGHEGITCSCQPNICEQQGSCCPDFKQQCHQAQDTCAKLGCTHAGATCSCGPNCTAA